MFYRIERCVTDDAIGIFRVNGICFENTASKERIEAVLSEAKEIDAPALMTREALCLYIDAPAHLNESMISMPVSSEFKYDGLLITRCTTALYNAKKLS